MRNYLGYFITQSSSESRVYLVEKASGQWKHAGSADLELAGTYGPHRNLGLEANMRVKKWNPFFRVSSTVSEDYQVTSGGACSTFGVRNFCSSRDSSLDSVAEVRVGNNFQILESSFIAAGTGIRTVSHSHRFQSTRSESGSNDEIVIDSESRTFSATSFVVSADYGTHFKIAKKSSVKVTWFGASIPLADITGDKAGFSGSSSGLNAIERDSRLEFERKVRDFHDKVKESSTWRLVNVGFSMKF